MKMNMSGLSLRDLEYVVAIADNGSFVRAAEHCRVAQPSLSAQVRKLENSLGIVVFERTTRRVIVTADGKAFVEQARRVLAEARLLFTVAQRSDEPFGGSLRLAAMATLGPYLFPRILPGVRKNYPNLVLVLSEGLTAELVPKLIHGEIDAVLLSLPQIDPALATATIFSEPFLLACPKGHPATRKGGPTWEALDANERLLLEEGHCLREQALVRLLHSGPEQSSSDQPGNSEIHGCRGRGLYSRAGPCCLQERCCCLLPATGFNLFAKHRPCLASK